MTVVSSTQDPEALSLTLVAELAAPPERVWQVWADAQQLQRWWGPPEWPSTFPEHDLRAGGRSHYYMTGPDGTRAHGWWRILRADEPHAIELEDGFADETGAPAQSMPVTRVHVELVAHGEGTRMTLTSHFSTAEQMQQLVAMGMVEGMTQALGQLDDLLATADA